MGEFFDFGGEMTDADGAMVGGTGLRPVVRESLRPDREAVTAVGIADPEHRAGDGIALSDEKAEFAVALLNDG